MQVLAQMKGQLTIYLSAAPAAGTQSAARTTAVPKAR
jgi:hypothetical protein